MKLLLKILGWPFMALIKLYQWLISPLLGPSCRLPQHAHIMHWRRLENMGYLRDYG